MSHDPERNNPLSESIAVAPTFTRPMRAAYGLRHLTREQRTQRIFVAIGALFIFFIVGTIIYRSVSRTSLVWSTEGLDQREKAGVPGLAANGTSEVRLQDFHRVEVKRGKPAWEIRAKEARYLPEQGLTQVNDAAVTIYRSRNSSILIRSKGARLYLNGSALRKAELEGDVVVNIDGSVFVETDAATYDVETGQIFAAGQAKVNGPGFEVIGIGLLTKVESREITFERDVVSRFEEWAQIPTGASSAVGP
jgi:LPS export ABC transporter protein LptC